MGKQTPVLGVEIKGWGSALPRQSLTNDELIREFEINSTNKWITDRTGIESRNICAKGESVVTLAVEAGRRALDKAGVSVPYEVDKLILGTTTSYRITGTHATIHEELGIAAGGSAETNSACTSFLTALIDAYRHFPVDGADRMLVIGADTLSSITDYNDRTTAVLLADGAGAVVLERSQADNGMLGWEEITDGSAEPFLYCEHGGFLKMNGREVYRRATKFMVDLGNTALDRAHENIGLKREEISMVVPHQANLKIIEYGADKLGISMDKMAVTIGRHGNTSSASIPLALTEALNAGRVTRGDKILLVSFGAGMTAAAAVLEV